MNKQEIRKIIEKEKLFLKNNYSVKNIGLFGSYLKGNEDKQSDIDILVEFDSPVSIFDFLRLENYLEKKLGEKVDLVTKKSLKPNIGKEILKELQYI